ncbi:MAG: membrane dipeptidase [Pseudomonadales bacterium]|nr:membrane dipeptidase [Pseudomonadales bacterium]
MSPISLLPRLLQSLLLSLLLVAPAQGAGADELAGQVNALQTRVMTLDTHVDIPLDFATSEFDPASQPDAQVNLDNMVQGGLDAAFFIVYVGQMARTEADYRAARADALTKFDAIHRMTDELYPDRIGLATTAAQARELHAQGKLVALIGIENGFVIGKDLSLLADFRKRGARYMTLVHNGHNDIGDSAQPQARLGDGPEEHGGLSDFGYQVVAELNRLGILVDVSHASRQTMLDATRHSRAPVIASHSSVTALADHPRNMNDEQLRVLRDNGGVIQIVAFDSYVKQVAPEKSAAIGALRRELGVTDGDQVAALPAAERMRYETAMVEINRQWPTATVAGFVDHIDYAVKLMGVDHVGISSDFGGGGGVDGWNNAGETGNVTRELLSRGYSEEAIAKIWSGNVLRILAEAEKLADELK